MQMGLYIFIGVAVFSAIMVIYIFFLMKHEQESMRRHASDVLNPARRRAQNIGTPRERAVRRFAEFSGAVRSRTGVGADKRTRERIVAAGFYSPQAYDAYFGIRFMLPLAMVILSTFFTTNFIVLAGIGGVSYLAPDFFLDKAFKKRLKRINRSLPDTVDLMVVCLDAGLGVDQAIQRTVEVLDIVHPDICYEIKEAIRQQRLGARRTDAWMRIVDRTKSKDIQMLASMFSQAETYGSPIVDSLLNLSTSLRTQRKQAAEEAAAKKSVQLLFPLVAFIFPALFIILLGPAVLSIIHGFTKIAH